jgi:hypothetical protein
MNSANPLTTVGLMLTLAGLMGTFFNIQLTQWLRDVKALAQKVVLNPNPSTDPEKKILIECKVELAKLANWQTYMVNLAVFLLVVFLLGNGLVMIVSASADPIYPNVRLALWVFLGVFVAASSGLFLDGFCTARTIRSTIYPAA